MLDGDAKLRFHNLTYFKIFDNEDLSQKSFPSALLSTVKY